jgi:hypothetical protein
MTIRGYETDPGSGSAPTGGALITAAVTNPATPAPAIKLETAPAPEGLYAAETPEFRYWVAAEAAIRARNFWHANAALGAWHPDVGAALPILLDQGVDLNAFYDQQALNFFHADVAGRRVYSAESPDVVTHEEGHAVLDALQPRLFAVSLIETAAFHEAFGDISSLLCALQLQQLRVDVLHETGGVLYRNSRLSRLEQLGWAIRQNRPTDVDADSLRNAVNSFVYRDPATLPTDGPATVLTSEAHSFSRVFSSAFLLALSNVFSTRPTKDEATLLAVSIELAQLLAKAIKAAPVVSRYYSAIAAAIVTGAPSADHSAIRSAFVRKKILPTNFPLTAAQASPMVARLSAVDSGGILTLTGNDFALDGDVEVDGGDTPSGSRVGLLPITSDGQQTSDPTPKESAHLFLNNLLHRDRVVLPNEPNAVRDFNGNIKSHKLVKQGKTYRLERMLFDCCNCGQH